MDVAVEKGGVLGMQEDAPTRASIIMEVESIQELVRRDSSKVPERYIRDVHEKLNDVHLLHLTSEIPIIDLSLLSSGHQDELNKLELACKDWGFFQIINHGVGDEILYKTKSVVADFFKLPIEEKRKYSMLSNEMNGYGHPLVFSEEQKLDWGDVFGLAIYPLKYRNPSRWPTPPTDFKDVIEEYSTEVNRVAMELLANLSLIMGMEKAVLQELHGEIMQILRINYYPTCNRPDQVLGLSPHSDSNSLTILLQDNDVAGLQIRHDGGWVPIKPMPNALLVNIGDCIEVWSNGKYKSIEHRAVTNKHKPRISMASFVSPSMDTVIEPLLDQMVDCQHQVQEYKKINYGEYVRHYLAKKLEGKSHTHFTKVESE